MRTVVTGLACVVLLVGCSTHERKFDRNAELGNDRLAVDGYAAVAARLIERQAERISIMPPESLASLARASSLVVRSTGAPRMRTIAQATMDRLLEARKPVGSGVGFLTGPGPAIPDASLTAAAGTAALEVARITGEQRYKRVARDAALALLAPATGWRPVPGGAAVDDPDDKVGPVIATTAEVGLFLARAAAETDAPVRVPSRSAFRTIARFQPAVGHWYASLGRRQPQTLAAWSTTMLAVVDPLASRQLGGIGGAGVPDLWSAAFKRSGSPRQNALVRSDRAGIPIAMTVLATYPDPRYAARVFTRARDAAENENLSAYAPRGDQAALSRLALAFATQASAVADRS